MRVNAMKSKNQEFQVVEALRREGGFATFRRLNEILDFSTWKTKTPEASVRRIVQNSKEIFRIKPGLWALEAMREEVLSKFDYKPDDKRSEELFSHGYYQGLLIEIGKYLHMTTCVPAQDKNRLFLGKRLDEVSDLIKPPSFTYEELMRRVRTVDVIWFNIRRMPDSFYEVEHTTDIKSSLAKFYELQDFFARFFIVADSHREEEFKDKLFVSLFKPLQERVKFLDYDRVARWHESLATSYKAMW